MSTFTINGRSHRCDGDPETPLLWYLRDIAGLTGTKFGCGQALIGPDRQIDAASMSDEWLYGEDPKLYPFDTGRLRNVIERAASEAGWGRKLPQGHGLGIAAHRSFVSYTAVVIERR
jgi:hypothetical protein